jgi:4-hydroxy-tetrahydrodipicolinate synthase
MLQGAMTAMITPFVNGAVDWDRLESNVNYQIDHGIDALVPTGTTGESPTLSHAEHRQVIEKVVAAANGRTKVIAGTGSNATSEASDLTRHAKDVGADAALVVSPYYNKPTQEGLYRHFATIADQVGLPIVLYNIPGRCGVTIEPQTVARLAAHENIVAIKEATGSLDFASEINTLCEITILSGDDSLTLPLMSIGAKGVISVLSNIIPDKIVGLVHAVLDGKDPLARQYHLELFPLIKGMFIETNPIPIKTAMALAGLDSGELRLPLSELAHENLVTLTRLLDDAGLRQ